MIFATLGPDGTCHHNAVRHYMRHFGLDDAKIVLFDDFVDGLELLHNGTVDYLVQNSAHLNVHYVTEKYHTELPVMDTFIYPTREMALLERADVEHPQTLGLVPACEHYLEGITYPTVVMETSKPVVARKMLEGIYDAGVVHVFHHTDNPGVFRMRKHIGSVLTGWLVYGRDRTYQGEVLTTLPREHYMNRMAERSPIENGA